MGQTAPYEETTMPETKTQKRKFMPSIRVGGSGMDMDAMRNLAQRHPEEFIGKAQALIDGGSMRWGSVPSLQRMFNVLVGDDGEFIKVPVRMEVMGQERTIMASAFPVLCGSLTVAGINDAYSAVPTISEQLVREIDDNKKISQFVSLKSEDTNIDRVDEGENFPEIGAGEEKYEIRNKRNGRRLTISAEMVEENDSAGIVQKVNALGEIAGEYVEEQSLRRICDIDGSGTSPAEPYVLRLNGTGTALYQTANTTLTRLPTTGNRITSNALVDSTDLENARARLAAVVNSRGKRVSIPWNRCKILVPDALVGTANKIRKSEYEPGVQNEVSNWGPIGDYQPGVVSSTKLDDLSTTAWYFGWFEQQFIRKWKLRFEYVTMTMDMAEFLRNRTAFQARIAWDCEVGATDYVYVVQNLAGTTAP